MTSLEAQDTDYLCEQKSNQNKAQNCKECEKDVSQPNTLQAWVAKVKRKLRFDYYRRIESKKSVFSKSLLKSKERREKIENLKIIFYFLLPGDLKRRINRILWRQL